MATKRKFVFAMNKDRQLDGDLMNRDLLNKVEMEGGAGASIAACMQCGTCSGGCTNVDRMDMSPRMLLLLTQRGEWEKVLSSQSLWMCSSCHICTSRCPRGVRPGDVIEAVKAIAIRNGIKNPSTRFITTFLDIVMKHGILSEPELLQSYGGIRAILDQVELGLKLALKGKVSVFPERIKDPQRFAAVLKQEIES